MTSTPLPPHLAAALRARFIYFGQPRRAARRGRTVASAACVVAALLLAPAIAPASPPGLAAAEQVSEASYYDFMNSDLFTHIGDDRGPNGPDLLPCRDNIVDLMQSYGLAVSLEPVYWAPRTYHNVVGERTGTVHPGRVYIIGAHYDSVSNPGADDNASGVALVLEAARILSQYDSDCTIRFVAFTMEEVGLVGSYAYVDAHFLEDIRGMVSADMLAYDPNTNLCNVYGRTASDPIKNALAAAMLEYGDGVTPVVGGDTPYSDHAPFEAEGFQACLLIEGSVWSNPFYHQPEDNFENPDNLNFPYAVRITRSVVGWLVDAAGVQVPVSGLTFEYPGGRPAFIAPQGGTPLDVTVVAEGDAVLASESVTLHLDDGTGWQALPMTALDFDRYAAEFRPAVCGTTVRYYLTADDTLGTVYSDPPGAPASTYMSTSAFGIRTLLADDFETDQGWTAEILEATSGSWQRGVPVNDGGWPYDPATDGDGSGSCYLTQNTLGNSDVDDGAVRLVSPEIDAADVPALTIEYAYFLALTDSGSTDSLSLEVSRDGLNGPWVEVARHDASTNLEWHRHSISADELTAVGITPTAQVRLRFTATDADPQSIVEAGIDGVTVSGPDCGTPAACPGDCDCNGQRDFFDIDFLLAALAGENAWVDKHVERFGQPPACDYLASCDSDNDGNVDFFDIDGFLAQLGQECP